MHRSFFGDLLAVFISPYLVYCFMYDFCPNMTVVMIVQRATMVQNMMVPSNI